MAVLIVFVDRALEVAAFETGTFDSVDSEDEDRDGEEDDGHDDGAWLEVIFRRKSYECWPVEREEDVAFKDLAELQLDAEATDDKLEDTEGSIDECQHAPFTGPREHVSILIMQLPLRQRLAAADIVEEAAATDADEAATLDVDDGEGEAQLVVESLDEEDAGTISSID